MSQPTTPERPLPAEVFPQPFAAEALARLGPLPCRVDEMTAREYALYLALMPAVAALQRIAEEVSDEQR